MNSKPLLYQAAQSGVYGRWQEYRPGSIADALFVYLDGEPSPESIAAVDDHYRARPIVCLTASWEDHIRRQYPDAKIYTRHLMKPLCRFRTRSISLPDGFTAALYDEKAFALHPFSHGKNYASFEEFLKQGSGAVIRHEGKIVSSASSFISLGNEVELDVSTAEDYRGKGLASACVSLMLNDCEKRGITVHWDAQNDASRHLAEKFGYETEFVYSVYFLPRKAAD